MDKGWVPPSARVAELMRLAAACGLRDAAAMSAVDSEAIGALAPAILADPALTASLQSTTRDNVMHWLSRIAVDPTAPVAPARSPNGLEFARDLVRRGYDTAAIATYLSGQNVAWRSWMKSCFSVTDDQAELQDLLTYSARSIFTYVEATIADLGTLMRAQRSILTHGTNADRLGLVSLLLEGAKVPLDPTISRLGHDLRRNQTALILWQDPAVADIDDLERAAQAAARAVGVGRPLVVFASAGSVWVWCSGVGFPDAALFADALVSFPHLRMAIGATAPGLAGFRQSHADALTTQRLMVKAREDVRVATYEAVRVAAFVTADTARADEFVTRTLGSLATADPMLQDTLRVYLREDASAARAARVLHTHRNTIQNRVARAETMLPIGLDGQGLAVALALEIVRWTGTRAPVLVESRDARGA